MIGRRGYARLLACLAIATALLALFALCVGRFSVDPRDVLGAIRDHWTRTSDASPMEDVLFVVRIPRVIAALIVGAALSLSGAAYQSVFRNPLISPDFLGVSSGASVGAASAILLGAGMATLQVFAFVGGLLAMLLATSLPRLFRNDSNLMLVLAGLIVSGLMNALLGILKFVAEEQAELSSIVFWQMGSLSNVRQPQLIAVAPVMLACIAVLMLFAWRINILSLGEEEARTVGVNITLLRGVTIACASLLTASAVSICGKIEWIGLVLPHFGRLLCGSDNTKLLPVTALLGGCFLLAIDTIARTATALEIPLSILTGLVGVPLFVWLIHVNKAKIL